LGFFRIEIHYRLERKGIFLLNKTMQIMEIF